MSALLPPEAYRYTLTRSVEVGYEGPLFAHPRAGSLLYVMQNPSTAKTVRAAKSDDDATIRKCIGFAQRWGFSSFSVVNLWGYRATKQQELWAALARGEDVVGPENDAAIAAEAQKADLLVCAWGRMWREPALERIEAVKRILLTTRHDTLWCVAENQDGSPQHPLMATYTARPAMWKSRREAA